MYDNRHIELPTIVSPTEDAANPGHHGLFDHKIGSDGPLAEMEAVRELLDVEIGMQRMIQRLQAEIGRLQRPDREIFEMRHIHHLSFEQIARQTGLSPSVVKDRCIQSIDKIRMRMKRRHSRA